MIRLEIPGRKTVELVHVVFDMNGTLTNRGQLLDGVGERIARLKRLVEVHIASADSFGTLAEIARVLALEAHATPTASTKVRLIDSLGPLQCAHVGNGVNDAAALRSAAVGIAVLGPEGLATGALAGADVVCTSVLEALDLLLETRALIATLRG